MKKFLRFIFFIVLIIAVFTLPVYATEGNETISDTIVDELNDFKDSLPSYVLEFLPEGIFDGDFSLIDSELLNEKRFFDYVIDYLLAGLTSVIKSSTSILILILISAIFEMLSSSFNNSSLKSAFKTCSVLTVGLTVFNICVSLSNYASTYINALCEAMSAFTPLMITLQVMSGNVTNATISNTAVIIFISLTEGLLISSMLPLIKICMMFSCINGVGEIDTAGFTKTIRTCFSSITIFIMSVFTFIFSMKNVLTQGADSLSLKTIRFALSSLVPMVGASINDALKTVSSSLSYLKSACGVFAIIIILLIIIPMFIYIFLNKLSFSLLSSISKSLNCNGISSILCEADALCTYMLTLVSCTSTLFIFSITIFIKTEAVLNS